MAAPNIVLFKKQILLQENGSKLNIIVENTTNIFGEVVGKNDLVTNASIGDIVLFDPSTCIIIKTSTSLYYIVNESDLIFKEI